MNTYLVRPYSAYRDTVQLKRNERRRTRRDESVGTVALLVLVMDLRAGAAFGVVAFLSLSLSSLPPLFLLSFSFSFSSSPSSSSSLIPCRCCIALRSRRHFAFAFVFAAAAASAESIELPTTSRELPFASPHRTTSTSPRPASPPLATCRPNARCCSQRPR